MKDKLILLFDHENLVRIMDIQLDTAAGQVRMACPGFEHMSRGTLNRILWDKVYVIFPPPFDFVPFLFFGCNWVNGSDEGRNWREREREEICLFFDGCYVLAQGDTGELMLACARGID